MVNKVQWENSDTIWNEFDQSWENAFLEIIVSAAGDDLQTAISALEPIEKKKFIKLVCKMNDIKIYEESKASITAKLNVESIKFALAEASKPKLEIKNAI